ncbi:MAG: cytochrome b [Sphingomonadales bacterium]|nr:cytochrome b [Sphingomonadales bacterium]
MHWTTALMVIFLWGGAHVIDWFPKGPLRVDARSVHIVVGGLLVALTAYRVYWRLTRGQKIPHAGSLAERTASVTHVALYVLIGCTLILGMANAWVRGDSLFGLVKIPYFGSYDAASRHALSEWIVGRHELGANLILILAAGHAVVGLFHHFVLRDDVLRRMVPQGRARSD